MADHWIAWDHSDCDHNPDPTLYFCSPMGTITCRAPADGTAYCRMQERVGDCETWSLCDYSDRCHAMCSDFEHHDTGPLHCTEGHRIEITENWCNAVDYIGGWSDAEEAYVPPKGKEKYPMEHHDGPIGVQWDNCAYRWWYV